MTYIRISGEGLRLKKYGAATVGPKTTVRIEVEVVDAYALAHLLQALGEIDSAQKQAPAKPRKPRQLLLTHDIGDRT